MSNDRSRLAFLLDLAGGLNDLAVMPATGGELRTVARGAHHSFLRWSPDDTRLAYTSDQGGSQDAWVVTPDDAESPRPLTDWVGSEQVLGWSADGSAIYVYAERESQLGDLWRIPVEGGEPERVTRDGTIAFAAIATPATTGEIILAMRLDAGVQSVAHVRADGSVVPFTTAADGNVVGLQLAPGGDLVALVSPGAGSMTMRLVRVADRQTIATVPNAGPQSFSLDGTRLAYQLPAGEGRAPDLGILDIATGTTTRVTTTPETESHAAFAADGNSIILRRVRITERVMRADVAGVLGSVVP
jgi:Tol biopolymer transport system component